MIKYTIRRFITMLFTLFIIATATFFLLAAVPGDALSARAERLPENIKENLYKKYGLDKPVMERYVITMRSMLHGDFGESITYEGQTVSSIIRDKGPVSARLGIQQMLLGVTVGLLLGIVAAVKRGTKWDTGSMLVAMLGVSMPSFIVGALLQYFLGLKLMQATGVSLFPITGWGTEMSKLLPSFALGFGTLAIVSRLMRTSMLDVLNQDYIKTAKAKGLSSKKIIWKHAVRNAIMPVITVLGPQAAAILTGAMVVEKIFAIPGMGKFFVTSITNNDYTMIAGTTIFYGAFLILANLVVDLVYGVIDPRVKLQEG